MQTVIECVRRGVRAVCLFALLTALYFVTYSGHAISDDELLLYDSVHSFAQHGNLWLSTTNYLRPIGTYPNNAPVPSLDSDPLQVFAALPLLGLAQIVPGFGLMQTVWLLNVLITAAAAVVLFYYGVLLGWRERTALIGALVFGVATMAWPYSKAFFREPLFTLLALSCAYSLERWRRLSLSENTMRLSRAVWLVLALVLMGAALFAKGAALLLIPTLFVIVLPASIRRLDRRALFGAVGLIAIGLATIIIGSHFIASGRYDVLARLSRALPQMAAFPEALGGYLLSPGRSLWAFSPVLLISLWGAVHLWRQKQWRQLAMPVVTLVVLSMGYAALQNVNWYGGLGWGPRYLLPVIPFLMLLLLPVIDILPSAPLWAQATAIGLTAQSVIIQVLGVITPVDAYFQRLAELSPQVGRALYGWQDGTWNLLYSPAAIVPYQVSRVPSDLAWLVTPHTEYVAILCAVVMAIGGVGLWQWRSVQTRIIQAHARLWTMGIIVSMAALLAIGLRAYYPDPRYGGDNPTLAKALDTLNAQVRPGDAVLLNDPSYAPYFRNYDKANVPIFVLPDSPGEVTIPGTPPQITAPNLDARVNPMLELMLPRIGLIAPRWWFIIEFVPADTQRTRTTEQYLTQHYFPVQEAFTSDSVRVIEFSAHSAPPAALPPWPSARSGATFAQTFTLIGDDVPPTIQRGAILPISLLWRFEGWQADQISLRTPFDYSINVSLIAANGGLVPGAQRSGTPLGTFGLTSQWVKGGYYRDNHGLAVPPNTPPGVYQVWVLLYNWQDGSHLPVTLDGSTTNAAQDHLVLTTIQVQ